MATIKLPSNFPDMDEMMELVKEMENYVWRNSISRPDIDIWLENFNGKVFDSAIEKRIAMWLLCNYTYYNETEIKYLCGNVYRQFIHTLASNDYITSKNDLDIYLRNRVYYAAADSAGGSGNMILYHFRKANNIASDRCFAPPNFPKGKDNILVFLNDVSLSGREAASYFESSICNVECKNVFYLTLIASDAAIKSIAKNGVTLLSSIKLESRDKCFSDDSMVFHSFPSVKEYARKMVQGYGELLYKGNALGFSDGQYCFGFYYSTPNNTLPIFWYSSKEWKPIFKRKDINNRFSIGDRTYGKYF